MNLQPIQSDTFHTHIEGIMVFYRPRIENRLLALAKSWKNQFEIEKRKLSYSIRIELTHKVIWAHKLFCNAKATNDFFFYSMTSKKKKTWKRWLWKFYVFAQKPKVTKSAISVYRTVRRERHWEVEKKSQIVSCMSLFCSRWLLPNCLITFRWATIRE